MARWLWPHRVPFYVAAFPWGHPRADPIFDLRMAVAYLRRPRNDIEAVMSRVSPPDREPCQAAAPIEQIQYLAQFFNRNYPLTAVPGLHPAALLDFVRRRLRGSDLALTMHIAPADDVPTGLIAVAVTSSSVYTEWDQQTPGLRPAFMLVV